MQQSVSVQRRQLSDSFNPLLQIFNAVTNSMVREAAKTVPRVTAQLIGLKLKGDNGGVEDNDDVTENAYGNYNTF